MSAQQQGLPVPRQQLLSWYSSLNKQVGTVSKKMDPGLLMQQGKWVDARKFVALSEQARLAALEQLPQPVAAMSAEAARAVHDAALLCSMLGHLPPVRLHVLRTSAHPDYSGPCQDEACPSPGTCLGNRFTWVDTVERRKLKVQWEHHKNARW